MGNFRYIGKACVSESDAGGIWHETNNSLQCEIRQGKAKETNCGDNAWCSRSIAHLEWRLLPCNIVKVSHVSCTVQYPVWQQWVICHPFSLNTLFANGEYPYFIQYFVFFHCLYLFHNSIKTQSIISENRKISDWGGFLLLREMTSLTGTPHLTKTSEHKLFQLSF